MSEPATPVPGCAHCSEPMAFPEARCRYCRAPLCDEHLLVARGDPEKGEGRIVFVCPTHAPVPPKEEA